MHCKTRENWPFSGSFFDFRVILTSGGYLLKITLKDFLREVHRTSTRGGLLEKGSSQGETDHLLENLESAQRF